MSIDINHIRNVKENNISKNTFIVGSNINRERKLGVANGKYNIPDDINVLDDEIAEDFSVWYVFVDKSIYKL